MTTTATPKKPKPSDQRAATQMATELQNVKAELELVNRFLGKIQTFSDIVGEAKTKLNERRKDEAEIRQELNECRDDIKSLQELIEASNNGIISLIEPGPDKFMPLFDKMEKASPTKHGTNAGKWRERPISILKLSPTATNLLYEAEILFIGQLQDCILKDPAAWWEAIMGLTEPIAAAIADKLNAFAKKGGDV